jgi:hypothetical protein
MSPITLIALTAHHTPTITSRNGTSSIDKEKLLFSVLISSGIKASFAANRNENTTLAICSSCSPVRNKFTE